MRLLLANFAKMIGDSGGLAKVHCAFANEMCRAGHDVLMMYSDDKEGKFFYPVDEGVKSVNLRHYRGTTRLYPVSYKLRREVYRAFSKKKARAVNDEFTEKFLTGAVKSALDDFAPDVIICFQPAATKTFLCDLDVKIPTVTMSHGDPEDYFHTYPPKELPALGKSTVCQVLMPSFAEAIRRRFPNMRVEVIGNVVPQYEEFADLSADKDSYKIIFVGRLTRNHKRPHLLIEAFASVAEDFPQWNVEIWGAKDRADYYKELLRIIDRRNLTGRVTLNGTTDDVASVLRTGDVFAFPSAYEGFGLSAAEAMSMGLPVVAYKNCAGINELTENGVSGILCEDGVAPLADGMRKVMADRALRVAMGRAARESMRRYSAENIWSAWRKLLDELGNGK